MGKSSSNTFHFLFVLISFKTLAICFLLDDIAISGATFNGTSATTAYLISLKALLSEMSMKFLIKFFPGPPALPNSALSIHLFFSQSCRS